MTTHNNGILKRSLDNLLSGKLGRLITSLCLDLVQNDDNTFLLTPRQFENNPVTYVLDRKEPYPTQRVNWVIESLHNKMYMLRKYPTNRCLTMRYDSTLLIL